MIVLPDDLTKYLNDQEFYDKTYLNWNLKGWRSLYNSLLKKNYKTLKKQNTNIEMLKKCVDQIEKFNYLIKKLS